MTTNDPRQALLDAATGPECPGALATVLDADGTTWTSASAGLDPEAPFRTASVTKTYVAAAVLRLVELGELALTDRVPLGDGTTATVEQLLRHTSGLADHASHPSYEAEVAAQPERVWTAREQVDRALALPRVAAPGTRVSYSDSGYVLLGELLAQRSGTTWVAAARALLRLDELGLTSTWVELHEPDPAGLPERAPQRLGELDVRTVHPSMDLFGGGGVVTTTRDLARFFAALVRGEVVSPETLALMTTSTSLPDEAGRDMGAGVYPFAFATPDWWGHTGFWNVAAGAQLGTGAAVAVVVLQRPPLAPVSLELAAALVAAA